MLKVQLYLGFYLCVAAGSTYILMYVASYIDGW